MTFFFFSFLSVWMRMLYLWKAVLWKLNTVNMIFFSRLVACGAHWVFCCSNLQIQRPFTCTLDAYSGNVYLLYCKVSFTVCTHLLLIVLDLCWMLYRVGNTFSFVASPASDDCMFCFLSFFFHLMTAATRDSVRTSLHLPPAAPQVAWLHFFEFSKSGGGKGVSLSHTHLIIPQKDLLKAISFNGEKNHAVCCVILARLLPPDSVTSGVHNTAH